MIDKIPFGKTGHLSTRIIFGAASLGGMKQDKADQVLELLLEFGINHIDTAAAYGESELRIGPWMREHRKKFFLATKTGDRTYEGARDSLHRSMERLRVDQLDLIQLHNLVDETEWQTALGPHGALEALVEARDKGLVRFIGVTGHGTRVAAMHRRSLERFAFDSVLFPYNFTMLGIPQYSADVEALLKLCLDSVTTFCTLARHALVASGLHARHERRAVVSQLARAVPMDTTAFELLLDMREDKPLRAEGGLEDPGELFARYLESIGRLVAFVDGLE